MALALAMPLTAEAAPAKPFALTESLAAPSCKFPQADGFFFWLDVFEVKPGQRVPLQALWTDAPGHFEPVPAQCVKSPIVAPQRVVRLSADGAGMDVAADAKDGTLINVAAVIDGRSVMSHARVSVPAAGLGIEVNTLRPRVRR